MTRWRQLTLAAIAVALIASVAVAVIDTSRPVVRDVVIEVPGLPREVTLLQVSDLHGRTFGDMQTGLARLVSDERFDAVVLTGDYTAGPSAGPAPVVQLVESLADNAPVMLAVMGNHDDQEVRAALQDAGVIFPGRAPFPLAADGSVIVFDSDARAAVAPVTTDGASAVTIALRHVPPSESHMRMAGEASPEPLVYLSGHTHGGQVRLPLIGAIRAPVGRHFSAYSLHEWRTESFPDLRGFRMRGRYEQDEDTLWVSSGLGTAFLPFRLLCRSEMAVIRLVPARD